MTAIATGRALTRLQHAVLSQLNNHDERTLTFDELEGRVLDLPGSPASSGLARELEQLEEAGLLRTLDRWQPTVYAVTGAGAAEAGLPRRPT